MHVIRTFHTIRNDGNSALHALLMAMETRFKENGNKMAHILYLQIDGGAENISKILFAILELFIAKGLCDKVWK